MRDILLTIIIGGLLPVCFFRPWIGVLVWTWIGLMNPHRLTYGFAFDTPWAMMVAIATLAGLLLTKDRLPLPRDRGLILVAILFAYFTMTTFFAWAPDEAWQQWNKVGKILLMAFIMPMVISGKYRIRLLLLVIALSIGFYGFKGGIWVFLTGGGNRVQGPRGGTFISSNTDLGMALLMIVPVLIYLAREENRVWLRHFLRTTAFLCIVSTVFTYSRGALVGLAATAPILFLRSKRKFILLLLLLPLAYFANDLLPTQLTRRAETIETYRDDTSAMLRLQAWSVAKNIAKDRPLTGAGFNFEWASDALWLSYADFMVTSDPTVNRARAAHSIYFQVLGQHGVVALGLFLLLQVLTLLRLQSLRKLGAASPDTMWIANYATAIQVGLIGHAVAGAFISVAYFDLFYAYIAITAILHREMQTATREASVTSPSPTTESAPLASPTPLTRVRPSGWAR
jgi:probable O-glycosylation ligase (exosortase A-associated)